MSQPKSKTLKERRTADGKLLGYIDTSVFPFLIFDKNMNPIGKQIGINEILNANESPKEES